MILQSYLCKISFGINVSHFYWWFHVQALSSAMERAFKYYNQNPEIWQQLVQKVMRMDFSWDSSAAQYEELYEMSVARARASARA